MQTEVLPRKKITLEIGQLLEAAEEMKKIFPQDHCIDILRKNFIKEVKNGTVSSTEELELDGVINIVGMVGSGKTTLLKTMAYLLDKLGKRVVIVTDTVFEVFNLYKYFHFLGCDCSPLVGKLSRVKYINQMIDEEYYLDEELSQYLTTNCLIDGLDLSNENVVSYGEEPCTKLEKGKEKYVCPYFDKCPTTAMQRQALKSNIVITTVAGFVIGKVGKLQNIFLKEALETADVVFYDECDRVQKNLDNLFTPSTEFNKFIKESALEYYQFMLKSNEKRMENMASMCYAELQSKASTVLGCISKAIKELKESGNKNILSDTFSSYTLLNNIQE